MSDHVPSQLDDQLGIRLLLADYCDVVTRRAWDEMPRLFLDDADISLDIGRGEPLRFKGGAEIAKFIGDSLGEFAFFEIVPLNSVTAVDGSDRVTGRLYIQEIRLGVGSGHLTHAFGLYVDSYQRDGDRWRFRARSYRSLARTSAALEVVSDIASLS